MDTFQILQDQLVSIIGAAKATARTLPRTPAAYEASKVAEAAYALQWGLDTDRLSDDACQALTNMDSNALYGFCQMMAAWGVAMDEMVRRVNGAAWEMGR